MKQVFYPYTMWEDYQNGMYDELKEGRADRVLQAARLLTDTGLLYEQMTRVTVEWPCATAQNFTNSAISHQAFLGQCACNIWGGVKEDETREAWGMLTTEERYAANRVADRVFLEWTEKQAKNEPVAQMSLFEEADA